MQYIQENPFQDVRICLCHDYDLAQQLLLKAETQTVSACAISPDTPPRINGSGHLDDSVIQPSALLSHDSTLPVADLKRETTTTQQKHHQQHGSVFEYAHRRDAGTVRMQRETSIEPPAETTARKCMYAWGVLGLKCRRGTRGIYAIVSGVAMVSR